MMCEPGVFLDSFSYPDHSQASDTVSVDSSDSMETSFSACSPDNISRWEATDQRTFYVDETKIVWIRWRGVSLKEQETFS